MPTDAPSRPPLPEGLQAGGRFADWAPGVPAYVVADVDGTLILRGTTATDGVAAAVAEAHVAGLRVGFATGRMERALRDLDAQLRLPGPHVVQNGAEVREAGRALATWPLAAGRARALAAALARDGAYAEFYVEDVFYATDRREAAAATWVDVAGDPAGLVAELDLDRVEVIKATVVAWTPQELPAILATIEACGLVAEPAPTPLLPGAAFVNACAPAAGKGAGMTFAAEHLGLGLESVVAVGDGLNDISMLRLAGTAIAMGQAPAAVREAAHVVVPEVAADGVAHALRAAIAWRAASL